MSKFNLWTIPRDWNRNMGNIMGKSLWWAPTKIGEWLEKTLQCGMGLGTLAQECGNQTFGQKELQALAFQISTIWFWELKTNVTDCMALTDKIFCFRRQAKEMYQAHQKIKIDCFPLLIFRVGGLFYLKFNVIVHFFCLRLHWWITFGFCMACIFVVGFVSNPVGSEEVQEMFV